MTPEKPASVPDTERHRRRPLLVRDQPDALGETWCWRFSLALWIGVAFLIGAVGMWLVVR